MRPHEMDIRRAVQDLEENGSSQDPIFYGGKETTPEQLEQDASHRVHFGYGSAAKIRIGYYGGPDFHLIKGGTLSGMVADRRSLRAANEREARNKITERLDQMKAEEQIQEEERMCDPCMPLVEWLELITRLIKKHGPKVEMFVDAGYNNSELRIDKTI